MPEGFVTPDTTGYLFLGLGAFFLVLFVYIGSLFVRARNLRGDEQTLHQLSQD